MKKYILILLVFSIVLISSCKEEPCNCKVEPYWVLLDYPLETYVNELLVTKSNYILLATSTKGILISKDKWKTWNKSPGISDTNIYTLKQLDDGRIAAIIWKNLYISNDEGQTWTNQKIVLPDSAREVKIAINGFLGCIGKIKSDNTCNYYISKDFGVSWETVPLTSKNNNMLLNIEAQNNNIILAVADGSTYYTTIYVNKQGENTFNEVNKVYGGDGIFKLWLLKDNLFIKSVNFFGSSDWGKTWTTKEKGVFGNISQSFGFNYTFNHEVMLMTNGMGIYYSTDFAESWIFLKEIDYGSFEYHITNDKYLIRNSGGIWFISKNPIL